jgi:hypothetical protein
MKKYIGTKEVLGTPMSRADFHAYRGMALPDDFKNSDDEPGYLVEYLGGGKANDSRHLGYISWSPAAVFEKAYRPITGLTFGQALEAMKAGMKVAREIERERGAYLTLDKENPYQFTAYHDNRRRPIPVMAVAHILADDWYIVQD